eukprot:gene21311-28242_t
MDNPVHSLFKKIVQGKKQMEGGGVMITRTLGTSALKNLDPYLMLDELKLPANKAFAGFPNHPHRGFETCSIMLEGKIEHRDNAGNQPALYSKSSIMLEGKIEHRDNAGNQPALYSKSSIMLEGKIEHRDNAGNQPALYSKSSIMLEGKIEHRDNAGNQLALYSKSSIMLEGKIEHRDNAGNQGKIEHRDNAGNQGVIGPGGVQWMTAGRGIIHSEMPKVTTGMLHGFQLWINLPKKDKMCKPRYQDYQAEDIPIQEDGNGTSVRVMAGESLGAVGPIKMRNPGLLMDIRMKPGASFMQLVPKEWSGFAYVYEGSGTISGTKGVIEQALVLGEGDHIRADATGPDGFKFLLIAGQPIKEPIVQHGPFVMNTQAEIQQAFEDYQSGKLQKADDNPWVDEL